MPTNIDITWNSTPVTIEGNDISDVPSFTIPRWFYDAIWARHRECYATTTAYQIAHWERLHAAGQLPVTLLPPDIRDVDCTWLAERVSEDTCLYLLTEGDIAFIQWLRSRYGLGPVLHNARTQFENTDDSDECMQVLWIDPDVREEIQRTMWEEQTAETANPLQCLLFCIGPHTDDEMLFQSAQEIVFREDNDELLRTCSGTRLARAQDYLREMDWDQHLDAGDLADTIHDAVHTW